MRPPLQDTIVAIATPLGEAGLGVVRLSGPETFAIAARLFSAPTVATAPSHTLLHGWVQRAGVRLDDALLSVFRAPRSYTGEDVVEFSCHGSPAVLRELVSWCQAEGARLARPGEFTERAYLNGKLDLAQAEAVASLISARSRRAAAAAAAQLAGGLSDRVARLRGRLIDLLAEIEANLDFVEEDIPNVPRARMAEDVASLARDWDELLASGAKGRWLRDGARVVLAGRPNVGKSSLFNSLLAEDRAIVSDIPGTTRDLLEESVQWDGYPVTLVDTAGLRTGGDAVEAMGAARARQAHARADVTILVLDASAPITDEDRDVARTLADRPMVIALNKSDRSATRPSLDAAFGSAVAVETSAVDHRGLTDLRRAVLTRLPGGSDAAESGLVVTSERQAERLAAGSEKVRRAAVAIAAGHSEEAVASDLRAAAGELAAITGEDVGEAVRDAVFRRFCIGK